MRNHLRLAIFSAALLLPSIGSAFEWPFFGDSEAPRGRRYDTAMQATCRDVDVSLDEGYGVAGHETRVVCQDDR